MVDFSGIMPNPTYGKVLVGIQLVKSHDIDLILGIGGGSVMDCTKRFLWELGVTAIHGKTSGKERGLLILTDSGGSDSYPCRNRKRMQWSRSDH